MAELNKLQQHEATMAAMAAERAKKREESQVRYAEMVARREHFARTGEIPEPPARLNAVLQDRLQQIKQDDRETLRNVAKSPRAFTGLGMPRPPHVNDAWKKAYFEAHNAANEA